MLVDVVLLRRKGIRLRPAELAAPVRGMLELSDEDGRHTSFKRPTRRAELYHLVGTSETRQDLLTPLFDAQVIRIEGSTFTILGIELDSADGRIAEHGQVWRCSVVATAP